MLPWPPRPLLLHADVGVHVKLLDRPSDLRLALATTSILQEGGRESRAAMTGIHYRIIVLSIDPCHGEGVGRRRLGAKPNVWEKM